METPDDGRPIEERVARLEAHASTSARARYPDLALLTVEDLASLLQAGEGTVRAWLRAGVLPGFRTPSGEWRAHPETIRRTVRRWAEGR